MKKKLVVLSGAGMSAESGILTFRDMGGMWEQFDVTQVASPQAWQTNPELVLEFYNQRRKKLFEALPNKGHQVLAELESSYEVQIVTQNVDDLHERAGSTSILHLHGELKKARSTCDVNLIYELNHWELKMGDLCEKGSQLRPHIVWFGETVDAISDAQKIVADADILVIVGTSLSVYPAAGLIHYVKSGVPIFVVDPAKPLHVSGSSIKFIAEKASIGLEKVQGLLYKHG